MATALRVPAPNRDADYIRALRLTAQTVRSRLRLPPKMQLSEWSDRYRVLSPEASAKPGKWDTSVVPYLREIMDTMTGREYQDITVIKCSQSAGSEGLLNGVGYYMDQEPSSILVIQPNVKPMGEAFSKTRVAPMIRDCERLRGKVSDPRSRDSGNTILEKHFAGGVLFIMGANSAAGLASLPIRIVYADEWDRWPSSAGTEGDPMKLAEARQRTFRHRKKTVKVTSPGNENESRSEKEWPSTDQRHYYVPCPHCAEAWDEPESPPTRTRQASTPPPKGWQPLEWRDSEGKPDIRPGRGGFRLIWEKEVQGEETTHRPDTAAYVCRDCACLIDDTSKPWMLANGRWVRHNPTSKKAGFHIAGFLSPWVRWREIATAWLDIPNGDEEQLKAFYNTVLGLLFVGAGEKASPDALRKRRVKYAAEVPMGAGLLTANIDVHDDRLEVDVHGWGEGEEWWHIRLEKILGDPEHSEEVWQRADEVLLRPWKHESGATLYIKRCMVDSGFLKDAVYKFVGPRQSRGVFASKGVDNAKAPLARSARAREYGVRLFAIHPNTFKDVLFSRLRKKIPGAGYMHYGLEEQTGASDEYFTQYEAERRRVVWKGLRPVVLYENPAKKRNEAIDHYVGNLAALRSFGASMTERLGKIAETVKAKGEAERAEAQDDTPTGSSASNAPAASAAPAPARQPPRRPGYVNSWR